MPDSLASLRAQSMYDLKGRVAIVTGAGTGIGLMIAKGLAANGAKVYVAGRRAELLQKLVDSVPKEEGQLIALPMDITQKESILAAKRLIQENDGKLHILVNNAGQVGPTSLWLGNPDAPERANAETLGNALFNEDLQGWGDLYAVNVYPVFFMTTAFLGLLDKGSKDDPRWTSNVVNITSMSGVIKLAQDHFCYNSAKGAVTHLSKILSTELHLKKVPVRVNAVAPGVYASEMTYTTITRDLVDAVGKGIQPVPLARDGTDVEIAGTVVYLASRAGAYTSGQHIVVDGGYCDLNPAVI
ncbi:hypothetical protein E1B28_012257 [Marasmius oreades]|uniref:Uncharacterized protein n=1 Tax=Marasmius oreades TaxID=181124 RepID=A0A9P7RSF6_9AGAR|nr:uncharacterized protein E1B28_012257 [Marasmius oreades]KAG7088243.1 hypothetical protein E1B28_012257 [Marasmius oreades]